MLPNLRLMIVAIMASILGMSCGLGVFAVFRVNHDSFVKLPSATPPLQLAFGNIAPVAFTAPSGKDPAAADLVSSDPVASFGARFEVKLPQSVGAAASRPAIAVPDAVAAAPAAPPPSDTAAETSPPIAAAASEPETAASSPVLPADEAAPARPPALAAFEPASEPPTPPTPAPTNDAGVAAVSTPEPQASDNSLTAAPASAEQQSANTAGNVPDAATDNAVQAPAQNRGDRQAGAISRSNSGD